MRVKNNNLKERLPCRLWITVVITVICAICFVSVCGICEAASTTGGASSSVGPLKTLIDKIQTAVSYVRYIGFILGIIALLFGCVGAVYSDDPQRAFQKVWQAVCVLVLITLGLSIVNAIVGVFQK